MLGLVRIGRRGLQDGLHGAEATAPTSAKHCGGKRKLISLIRDGLVARSILEHLGLCAEAPRIAPARPPPEAAFAW